MNEEVMKSIRSFNYDDLLKDKYFNTEDVFKFKIDDEGRRMKLYLKFSKQNSDGWKSFYNELCPTKEDDPQRKHFTEEEFAKLAFFRGMAAMMEDVKQVEAEMAEEAANEDTDDGEVTVL